MTLLSKTRGNVSPGRLPARRKLPGYIIILCLALCPVLSACAGNETPESSENNNSETAAITYTDAKDAALAALLGRMADERSAVWVYRDFGMTENHFTQKAKMWGTDELLVKDMDENCTDDPCEGSSCIRCSQTTREGDWGGWLFLSGYLPKGETVPQLNDGSMDGQGLDLSGATELKFAARGENGGEAVEFFTAGFGYDGVTNDRTVAYPDSSVKKSTGTVVLDGEWKEYSIPLDGADMSYIVCGFGFVLNSDYGAGDNTFYIDNIRFEGVIESAQDAPAMLRSYDTDNTYIKNAAYTYDNALALMAFIAEDRQAEAKQLADAFVYAVNNDRSGKKRIRNAYAAGDISAQPGWESGARLPGWYDNGKAEWLEDRYQVGSNVGNTSYAALALLQYRNKYGGSEYLEAAEALMDWVIDNCSDSGDGFTGGLYGTEEGKTEYKERGYGCSWSNSYVDVAKLIAEYRSKVNPKENVFSVQTAGYTNVSIPEYGYRTNILYGWTGKEAVFADAMIKFWDEKDAQKE